MKNGICQKKKKIYGFITVTDKGQVAIPIELRKELGIGKGDKLIVVKREDQNGVNLIKVDAMDKFVDKLSKE